MKVDKTGLQQKLKQAREAATVLKNLHEDAASYIQNKLVSEVLNGPAGSIYPKSGYPTSVTPGAKGFVGVNSGQLRQSVQQKRKGKYETDILIDSNSAAIGVNASGYSNYGQIVDRWARQKYGKGFMQIAVTLYGDFVERTIREEFERFLESINSRSGYTYRNPFPA